MSVKKSNGPVFDPGLCRCCGTMRKCRLLDVEYDGMGQKEIYSDMIMDCFGLLMSYLDGKPSERLICANCVKRLRESLAFRKQVLQCEEAFLQMRMYDAKIQEQTSQGDQSVYSPKVEVEIIKMEPNSPPSSPARDMLDDSPMDSDAPVKQEASPNKAEDSSDDEPLQTIAMVRSAPTRPPPRPTANGLRSAAVVKKKPVIPMSKLQQRMRERDPTYMTETNILTIVEYSFVCPFKCRHNHLKCYYCGHNVSDPTLLRLHTDTFHHPNKFKVIEHKNMIKVDITRIDCRLCPAKIATLDEFKQHISTVHKKKYYFDYKDQILPFKLTKESLRCAICNAEFPYFHALNKHMNAHFSNYVCETCGLGFVGKARFLVHQQRHEQADFPCETCGKVFKAQYNRDLHIDRVHKKRGRVYCPKCDAKLMSYHQKLKHLVEVHGETPMSFPCPMCDRVFDSRRNFTIHTRKEHLKDYRYECQCCGQKFFTRFALNNHMPTHTGERNFKCKVCDKSYPRLKTLKDHMRIHTNDRRYRCHICGQAFIQNCSLKGHMKSQHPEYG
ncbi:zinc finger protein 260-like [Pectinophora gossypiella]|uniref:zinc finger protein 260-like n=1 Tax=Pectinophora gossypiella TaxID=13191 RepID=UPI00214F0E20|nr:zinc finger protein 260-like [Pectinophora gossypiella]